MRLRSLSVAILAAAALVPVTGSVAAASETGKTVTGVTSTYKTSAGQRAKRAARKAVAPAPTVTAPVASSTAVSYADRLLALTNTERKARGLRPLALSACADGFADAWAVKLAAAGALSHQPLTPIMTTCRARGAGENVAYGNVTPEQMMAMWMASAGHRANILNPGYTHLGVGTTRTSSGRTYGVQVFLTL